MSKIPLSVAELRRKAEERVANPRVETNDLNNHIDSRRLLHELEVYQEELEMQNDELRQTNSEKSDHVTHLRNIITQIPAGYFYINCEGYIQEVNNAWLRMYGYESRDEVLGKHFTVVKVESESKAVNAHLAELKRGVPISSGQFACRRKDGTVGYHIFSAQPVVYSGEIVGSEWFIIDGSERKQIDDVQSCLLQISSLHPGEDIFESLALFLARTLHIDYVCIDRLLGDSLSTRSLAVYHDGKFKDSAEYTLKDSPRGAVVSKKVSVFTCEVQKLFPNDTLLQDLQAESYMGITLWSYDMKPIGLITVIGRNKLLNAGFAESVLRLVAIRAAGELERRQAEDVRTQLTRQLSQSQKMEAIGQLAGGIAHDFNNKLMVILGNSNLAMMDIFDSNKMMGYLEEIHRAAEHSRYITNRLLAFSRQEVMSPQSLNANLLIADSLKSLTRLIGEHVSITLDADDKLWSIRIDPSQLDQIVMNLAINARDAMPDGGTFAIETRNITLDSDACGTILNALPGDYVRITFTDTGTGMDSDTLTHIFEPFFTTKEIGKGTGLGLATVYGIAGQNNCLLKVASKPGQGAEFNIYFPRCDIPVQVASERVEIPTQCSASILLVEDEDAVRTVTALYLKKIGHTVYEAATPHVALEFARDFSLHFDLVLTDFVMPGMNGLVMMEQMREIRHDLKYIVASGYSTGHELLQEVSQENISFIQKPYDFSILNDYINRALTNSEVEVIDNTDDI